MTLDIWHIVIAVASVAATFYSMKQGGTPALPAPPPTVPATDLDALLEIAAAKYPLIRPLIKIVEDYEHAQAKAKLAEIVAAPAPPAGVQAK